MKQSFRRMWLDLVQAKMKGRKRQTEQGEYSMQRCRITSLCRVWRCVDVEEDAHQLFSMLIPVPFISIRKAHCTQHRVDADDLYDVQSLPESRNVQKQLPETEQNWKTG